jgi:hypothetical protein
VKRVIKQGLNRSHRRHEFKQLCTASTSSSGLIGFSSTRELAAIKGAGAHLVELLRDAG